MRENMSSKRKVRQVDEKQKMMNRLSRIEGQIRCVKKMIEEDRYCIDILLQVSALSSALDSFGRELLANHIQGCIVEDIQMGKEDSVTELCDTIKRILK